MNENNQEGTKERNGGAKFEKTIAAQIEKALAKEFTDSDPPRQAC